MAKDSQSRGTFPLLTAYGIAMAYVEAIVVVYLRTIMPLSEWERQVHDVPSMTQFLVKYHVLWTEQTREAATIIMLLAVAILSGATVRRKIAHFLYTFAIWDIFYYVFLYALIKWPPTLATLDLLFLLPGPWVAPVYVPVSISCVMIALAILIVRQESPGKAPSKSKKK